MIVLKLLTVVYIFCLLPLLCGMTFYKIFKLSSKGISDFYVCGYAVYFSLIWITVVVCSVFAGMPLMQMERIAYILFGAAGIALLLYCRTYCVKAVLQMTQKIAEVWKRPLGKVIILAILALMVFSVLFTIPHDRDLTPEIVLIAKKTGTPYAYQPYYNTPYGAGRKWTGLEILYVIGSDIAGIDGTRMIHMILPICLLPFFFGVYEKAGAVLFGRKRKQRQVFFLLVMGFYLILLFTQTIVGLTPFQNIWNGETLVYTCVMPLIFLSCMKLQKNDIPQIVFLIQLMMAAQLCYERGGLYAVILTAGIGLIFWIRKGIEHAGSIKNE